MYSSWRPSNWRVSKMRYRGIALKGQFLTLSPLELRLCHPTLEKGASCLVFGSAPSELGRQIGTAGLLIELIAGVSYCTKSCQLATRSFARKLTSPAKNQQKRKSRKTRLKSQFLTIIICQKTYRPGKKSTKKELGKTCLKLWFWGMILIRLKPVWKFFKKSIRKKMEEKK